jgi:hypothetical protein
MHLFYPAHKNGPFFGTWQFVASSWGFGNQAAPAGALACPVYEVLRQSRGLLKRAKTRVAVE